MAFPNSDLAIYVRLQLLTESLNTKDQLIQTIEAAKTELSVQLRHYLEELKLEQEAHKATRQQFKSLEEENIRLASELKASARKAAELENKLANTEKARTGCEAFSSQLATKEREFTSQLNRLNQELVKAQHQLIDSSHSLNELKVKALEDNIKLKAQLDNSRLHLQTESEATLDEAFGELGRTKKKLQELTNELDQAKAKEQTSTEEVARLQVVNSRLADEKAIASKQLQEQAGQIAELKAEATKVKAHLAASLNTSEERLNVIKASDAQLSATLSELEQVKATNQQLQAKLTQLRSQLTAKEAEILQLRMTDTALRRLAAVTARVQRCFSKIN